MVVEDHPLYIEGLTHFIQSYSDMLFVGQTADGQDALRLAEEFAPDVILMDLNLPKMPGNTAIEAIHAQFPEIHIIALTGSLDEHSVKTALQAGASGFLLKTVTADELAAAIHKVHAGGTVLSPEAARILMKIAIRTASALPELTRRESEVLALMVAGHTNAEIASHLELGRETIKSHVSHLLSKLGASGRVEAVAIALRHDLLSDHPD
jgi:DNA-binding NarL/FixJ family response regulator